MKKRWTVTDSSRPGAQNSRVLPGTPAGEPEEGHGILPGTGAEDKDEKVSTRILDNVKSDKEKADETEHEGLRWTPLVGQPEGWNKVEWGRGFVE